VVKVPASQPPQPAPEKLPDNDPEGLLEDPDNDSADLVVKKFKESIMEAERSTVIFNLDMGKVPLLNKETMSKRATLALTAMAAAKEERNFPSPEAVEAIDDVLSITKKMEFFGNTTKSYKHPTDPKSGAFCTVPVCYEFRDKAMKHRAETILKDCCGVQSSTPYPVVVRECIKQIVADVKKKYPDNFVRVAIDLKALTFKVARKPPKNAPDPSWKYREEDVPIPAEAMDLSRRRAPRGFKLTILPSSPKNLVTARNRSARSASSVSSVGNGTDNMDMSTPAEAGAKQI
jgi:hypothetical protein